MSNICQRVVNLREFLGLNQSIFATELDIKRPTLAGYEKGTFPPSTEFLLKIREVHNVNIDWLLTGEGEMFLSSQGKSIANLTTTKNGVKIPLLKQKVSCGQGVNWETNENIEEYIEVDMLIPRLGIGRVFAVKAQGSSMLGAGIRAGDYIFFDGSEEQMPQDGIYVFALDGDVYCKRLEFDKLSKKIKVYSVRVADLEKAELVTSLDTNEMEFADRFRIFGKVTRCIRLIDVEDK